MYQADKRARHYKPFIRAVIALVVVVLAVVAAWLFHFKPAPKTAIASPPPAQVQTYNPGKTQLVHVDKALFSLDLPHGWREKTPAGTPRPAYSFQSTDPGTKELDIYADNLPSQLAINRVLAVQAAGAHISHDTASDNCTSFLPPSSLNSPQAQTEKVVEARWDGVNFWCDLGNYQRDVVGTSSATAINQVTLQGTNTGTHSFFFTFTDNDIAPDFTDFYTILDSFTAK